MIDRARGLGDLTAPQLRRLRELFDRAIELTERERSRWLDEEPDLDPRLREALHALLAASPVAPVTAFFEEDESRSCAEAAESGEEIGPAPLPQGTSVGTWRLGRRLAITATAEVYESQCERSRRPAAVKLLRAAVDAEAPDRRTRVETEALARLFHPGIVPIYDAGVVAVGPASRRPYIAMGLVVGERFDHWMERARPEVAAIADLLADAAEAVHHANLRGVVHRDLKPSNLLVRPDGRIAVIDFGVAKLRALDGVSVGASMQSMAGSVVGTPAYMAPEQFTPGESDVDLRADVYSLGVIAYEAIAGRLPIEVDGLSIGRLSMVKEGTAPAPLNRIASRRVPRELADAVAVSLHPDPRERYPSCSDLAADLRRSVRSQPLLRRPPGAWRRATLFVARRRSVAIMLAVSAALLAAAIAVAVSQWADAVQQRRLVEARSARERLFAQGILREAARLADISGTLEVRRDLFARAAQHLDAIGEGLVADSARWTPDDVALAREIVLTRLDLARMLGYPAQENLGDLDASRREVGRAIWLLEALVSRDPADADAVRMLGVALRVRSYAYSRDPHPESEKDLRESGAVLQRACELAPEDPRGWLELAESRALEGVNMFRFVDESVAAAAADKAFDDAHAAARNAIRHGAGVAGRRAAAQARYWALQERQRRSALSSREAMELQSELHGLLKDLPADRLVRSWALLTEAKAGRTLAGEGRFREGTAITESAVTATRALVDAEPANHRWTRTFLQVLWECGDAHRAAALDPIARPVEERAEHWDAAIRRWRECGAIVQRLAELGWAGTIEQGYIEELRVLVVEAERALAAIDAPKEASTPAG